MFFFSIRILLYSLSSAFRLARRRWVRRNARCSKLNWSSFQGWSPEKYVWCLSWWSICLQLLLWQACFPSTFHKLLGRKNATTEVHEQLVSMLSTIFLSLTLPESVTKLAAASEHQTQRVLSSFPWAHDDDLVHDVEVVEETLEQPLDVQTWFPFPYSILYQNRRF